MSDFANANHVSTKMVMIYRQVPALTCPLNAVSSLESYYKRGGKSALCEDNLSHAEGNGVVGECAQAVQPDTADRQLQALQLWEPAPEGGKVGL